MSRRDPDQTQEAPPGRTGAAGGGSRGSLASERSMGAPGWRLRAEELSERAQEWVQHRPGMALLVAAGLGFGFARLLTRRR